VDFVYVLLFATVVLFGPWILLARSRGRLKREREENAERWADLTKRIHDLEKSLKELQAVQPRIEMPARQAEVAIPGQQPRVEIPAKAASVSPAAREPALLGQRSPVGLLAQRTLRQRANQKPAPWVLQHEPKSLLRRKQGGLNRRRARVLLQRIPTFAAQ
jgi:hypothetical protein